VGVVYERRHTRMISDFGGLWKPLPVYAAVFLVVMLSSIGLPGTNGFVGEFLVLLGAWRAHPTWAVWAASGVILSAVYMLWMFQRVIFGPVTHPENEKLADLSTRERLVFAPLLILIFWMGFMPQPLLTRMQPTLDRTIQLAEHRANAELRIGFGAPAALPPAPANATPAPTPAPDSAAEPGTPSVTFTDSGGRK
jgi:NADH-quinone oxidoreductase subunit M